jgi:hypothetical protein
MIWGVLLPVRFSFQRGGGLFLVLGCGATASGLGGFVGAFGLLTPENEDVADLLHRRAVEMRADGFEQGGTVVALDAVKLDLDQLMGFEREIDFLEDVGRQAVAGDGDGRIEMMRGSAQCAAFNGR